MSSELRLSVSDVPGDSWQRDIERCDATVYVDPRWQQIVAARGGEPRYFRWVDESGRAAALAAGTLKPSSLPVIGSRNAVIDFGSTPAIHPDYRQHAIKVLNDLRRAALDLGCKRLSLESHMGQDYGIDSSSLGFAATPRLEFRISLDDAEDELFSRMSSHHRRKIRKAGRSDLQVEEASGKDAARALRGLQHGSQARRESRGESMRLGDDEPIVELMHRVVRDGLGKLYLATMDDEIVSGALISTYRDRAYYVFGGSNPRGFKLDAPAALFWRMIRDCRNAGVREFNLGGVPGEARDKASQAHGLFRFKDGFGGTVVERSDLTATLRPVIAMAAATAAKLLRRG